MSEEDICYYISRTLQPGWRQDKADPRELEAIALKQKQMLEAGRTCWLTDPTTGRHD